MNEDDRDPMSDPELRLPEIILKTALRILPRPDYVDDLERIASEATQRILTEFNVEA